MSDDKQPDLEAGPDQAAGRAPAREPTVQTDDPDDPDRAGDQPFDAISAAAELADVLSAVEPVEPVEQHGESYTDILESEVAQLTALVDEREAEIGELRDELHRSLERVQREYERQLEQHTRSLVLDFLEVLDNLDRALASARSQNHDPAVVDGVELVRKGFLGKLARIGVTHDPSLGETFDPNLHEAVSVAPVNDSDQAGKVVAVIREGYLLGDKTLRPAGVIVGKKSG